MNQLGELNDSLEEFTKLDTSVLCIHTECGPSGTALLARKLEINMANDDQLNVVGKYSVTSTYLIDREGVIRARWLDRIHKRVQPDEILAELNKIDR